MPQPFLAAGSLDRRIEIVTPVVSQDATGEPIATDGPKIKTWARLMEQRLSEVFSGASDQTSARLVFRIRWRSSGVGQDSVVIYAGQRFEIVGIQEYGRRVGLDLICRRLGENV